MSLGIIFLIMIVFTVFPEIVVGMLYGNKYLTAAKHLPLIGLYASIFSIDYLLVNYFMSREKTLVAYILVVAAFLQAGGIFILHKSISQVVWVSIIVSIILFILLTAYGLYNYRDLIKFELNKNRINIK